MNKFDGIVLVEHNPGSEHAGTAIYFITGDGERFVPVTRGIPPVDLAELMNIPPQLANESGIGNFVFRDPKYPFWHDFMMQSTTAPQLANYFDVPVWLHVKERDKEMRFIQKVIPVTED